MKSFLEFQRINEAEDLDEAVDLKGDIQSGNEGRGYHGQHDSNVAAKKYSDMHATVKKVADEAGHLKYVKKPNLMVKHYLDSARGRHIAGRETDHEYIGKDFGIFKKDYKSPLHESHLIHVSDGSKYNDKPNKKDVSHVMSGVKIHGGVYDNATDKGAIFKFKSHSDADNFRRHVDKCPGGSCYADHINEAVDLEEAKSVSDSYKNLPGKSTHMLNKDVRGVHGIIHMGTLLRHTGGDRYEVRAGKARGETLSLHKNHVMLPPDFDEETELDEADRIPFVNGRTHAQAGKMLPSMSKHMTVGQEHDYYHPKSGNKISGVVKHKSDTEVHMQANKEGKLGGGDTHKFTISEEIPPWKTDSDLKKRKSTSFKKLNNPTRTGNDAARALAMRGLSAARKKVEEAISVKPNTVQKLKAALDRHTDLAVAANKAGDNDAVKVHQVNANKIKTKLGNLARNPNHYNESGTDAAKVPATNEEDLNELSHDKLTSYIRRAKHDERKNRSTGVVLAQKKKWGGLVSGTDAAKVPATNEEDKLIGKQKVLDKNRNGKLDAHDFKLLRKEESEIEEDFDPDSFDGEITVGDGEEVYYHAEVTKNKKLTYKEMVEGTFTYKDGVTTHRGDYGTSYYKDVAKDDKDDELNFKTKKTKTSANKPIARKSGRPVGSKSGARDRLKSDTPSYGGIAFHGYNGPTKI